MLDKIMKEHNYEESSLLEILHKAQEIYGFLGKTFLHSPKLLTFPQATWSA